MGGGDSRTLPPVPHESSLHRPAVTRSGVSGPGVPRGVGGGSRATIQQKRNRRCSTPSSSAPPKATRWPLSAPKRPCQALRPWGFRRAPGVRYMAATGAVWPRWSGRGPVLFNSAFRGRARLGAHLPDHPVAEPTWYGTAAQIGGIAPDLHALDARQRECERTHPSHAPGHDSPAGRLRARSQYPIPNASVPTLPSARRRREGIGGAAASPWAVTGRPRPCHTRGLPKGRSLGTR